MSEKIRFISLITAETTKWISVLIFISTTILIYANYTSFKYAYNPESYKISKTFYDTCITEHPPEKISWFCGNSPQIELYNKDLKSYFYDQRKGGLVVFVLVFTLSALVTKILSKTNFTKRKIHDNYSYFSTLIINSINKINTSLLIVSFIILLYSYFYSQSCSYLGCALDALFYLVLYFIPYSIFSFITFKLSKKFKFEGDYSVERTDSTKTFAFIVFCISRTCLFIILYNILVKALGIYGNPPIIIGAFLLSISIHYLVLYRNLIRNTEIINNNITTTSEIDKILENVANRNNQ